MTGESIRISGFVVLLAILILPSSGTGIWSCDEGNCECALFSFAADDTSADSFDFPITRESGHSDSATITIATEPDCSPHSPHRFSGLVTIDGEPAPEYTNISVAGPGVCSTEGGNPVYTNADGSYGSAVISGQALLVQGCIDNGTPLAFSVNGIPAEVYDVSTGGPWQSTYPFRSGAETTLHIRIQSPVPPPDDVYINALGVTLSNATYGFFQTVKVEKNPWIEIRVTSGVFHIHLSATGFHDFQGHPVLGRSATLGIYEDGILVSPEITVPFGSKEVTFDYLAHETKTFDILIFVNEQPEIFDVKHLTITTISRPKTHTITATAGPGGSISPGGEVKVDAGAAQRFDFIPSFGYQIAEITVDGESKGAISGYHFSDIHSDHQIQATFAGVPPQLADYFDALISQIENR
jgi:hypothetical protein